MECSDSLGLDAIVPAPKVRRFRFTEDEWLQVHRAREKGLSWGQIHEATGRYKNEGGLKAAYTVWKRTRT